MAIDPVCHGRIDDKANGPTSEFDGERYYFCSTRCKGLFEERPDFYTQQAA